MDHVTRKRKKRKSLVQTVKKKFKNNFSGTLGARLDLEVHEYFLRVFQQSRQEFTDDNDRRIFIDNVLSQTNCHEIEYSSNQLVSRIIESFLPESSETVLQKYLSVFGEDLRPISCHQFASHVLESLLKISSKKVLEQRNGNERISEDRDPSENRQIYLNFVLKVSKFLLNNLDEFLLDPYANYVTRTAISCLCGNVGESKTNSKILFKHNERFGASSVQAFDKKSYPSEFKLLLRQFADRILHSHMFSEFAKNVLLSGLVQTMLLSLHIVRNKKLLNSISLKLVTTFYCHDEKEADLSPILANQEAVHLLNTMIITSTEKVYEDIKCKCFIGRMKKMALSKTANYCVQKFIERSSNAESFNSIYDELSDSFQEIVQNGHSGVLLSISKMCHKLQTKEKPFVKDLKRSLQPVDNNGCNFVLQLLSLGQGSIKNDVSGSSNFFVNLHGCLILQELLKFNKSEKVVKSLLNIDSSQFLQILCDQKGSHIVHAFFENEMNKDKYRNNFMDKLKGSYVSLATNKYGSFVFTAVWKVADIDQKLFIVKELANKQSLLFNSPCGKHVSRAVGLETYCHQPREWENAQKDLLKSREIFAGII